MPWIEFLEVFSGVRSLTSAFARHNYVTATFELMDSLVVGQQDILDDYGWVYLLGLVLRLRPGAACWLAPVCSTWTWCSRSSTARAPLTMLKAAEGAGSVRCVRDANVMVCRLSPDLF